MRKLPKHKSYGPETFMGKFYQTFQQELITIFLNVFHKIAEGMLPNSFCKARINLMPKPYNDNTKIVVQNP